MADLTGMLQAAAGTAASQGGYQIERSLRFNSADSAYLNRTNGTSTDQKKFTLSFWMKRGALTSKQWFFSAGSLSGTDFLLGFNTSSDALQIANSAVSADGQTTTMLFRDTSAWYHVVVAGDSTQATNADRIKIYVNGVQQATSVTGTIALNSNFNWNANSLPLNIGRYTVGSSDYANMYLADIYNVDGQALTPSSFGETDATTGVWKPKAYAGTYGTNGFHLDFSDNTSTTTIGYDAAGSNNWTANNFSVAAGVNNDSLVDTPTPYGDDTGAGGEVRGNYATFNPLDTNTTPLDGNLRVVHGVFNDAPVTMTVSSGKWYMEATCVNVGSSALCGFTRASNSGKDHTAVDSYRIIYEEDGNIYRTGTGLGDTSGVATYTTNDIIGAAIDMDNGTISFYKNNTLINTSTSASAIGDVEWKFYTSGNGPTWVINMGQRPFAYTAPSGFKALCTQNLPDPTVVQGDDYFNTVLYTGTGSSQSITGVGFQPDWVWIKERSGAADHGLYDAVRGVQEQLESNTTTAETTESTGLTAFGSDGFTVGALAQLNTNTDTYVAWNWNAGGSNDTNTDGTITSTVRANPTAGFSIVSYTGTGSAATVGHGLGAVPAMIIVKNRDQADAWQVYHQANTAAPETDYLVLNTTAATADSNTRWNDTAPTSSVFSIGTGVEVNTNTEDYIAYVFAEIEGYSKFSSYVGNGSTDGSFVYCGFRPAFVLIKRSSGVDNWRMFDTKRLGYNPNNYALYPSVSNAEGTESLGDITSNGFKVRNTATGINASGQTYCFMAFAENPFKYSLAR